MHGEEFPYPATPLGGKRDEQIPASIDGDSPEQYLKTL